MDTCLASLCQVSQPKLYLAAQLTSLNLPSHHLVLCSKKASFCCQIDNKFLFLALMTWNRPVFSWFKPCTPPEEELLLHSKHSHIFQRDSLPYYVSSWNTFLHIPIGTCQAAINPTRIIVIHFLHGAPQLGVISGPRSLFLIFS